VVYDTPKTALRQIPDILRECVENTEDTRFDRAHFQTFGDFSLDFEVVFYVVRPEYNIYMGAQQSINFAIAERLEALGVGFAFPTQTIHLLEALAASEP